MIQLCLIKVLDYESQEYLKKKRVLECEKCPVKEKCAKWVSNKMNREYHIYTVKKGDSLYSIHKFFNSPIPLFEFNKEILKVNNIKLITLGSQIRIPKDICGVKENEVYNKKENTQHR